MVKKSRIYIIYAAITMLYTNIICTSALFAEDKAELISKCIKETLANMKSPQPFTDAEKGCESGSTSWSGQADSCSTMVCYEAPAGKTIISASIENVSSHGQPGIGPIEYKRDNTGRVYQVCVSVWAQSPSGMDHAGEHGWQKIRLHGIYEAFLNEDSIIAATMQCVQKYNK